jgi:hypothetical protein
VTNQKIVIVLTIILTLTFSTKAFAAFTLSSNAITGTVASTIDLGAGNALSLQTTNNGNIIIGNGTTTIGSATTLGQGTTSINGGTLSGTSTTSNFLNVTGTLNATNTAISNGVYFIITSAGSSPSTQRGVNIDFNAGHTGVGATVGLGVNNSAAGTSTNGFQAGGLANIGSSFTSSASTTGNNVASGSAASGSSSLNLGSRSNAISATNSPVLNVGVAGTALNATKNVGGFFGLMNTTTQTFGTSSALVADNGAVAADIFEARDNGTPVFSITDGGNVSIGSNLTFSPTAPTVASGFGSSNTVEAESTTTSWAVTVTTSGGATTGTLTLPSAAHRWTCFATDQTTNSKSTLQSGGSATTAVFTATAAWLDGDVIIGGCTAH